MDAVKCHFCPAECPDVEAAVESGWEPGFVRDGEYKSSPVCPACVDSKLVFRPEVDDANLCLR